MPGMQWRVMREAVSPHVSSLALIPGLGSTAQLWSRVADQLGPEIELVVAELPGHGDQAPAARFTIELLAAQLLEALPVRTPQILVGHSMGGAIAMEMARSARGRFAGLLLVCTSDRFGDENGWRAHIDEVRSLGLALLAQQASGGWFSASFVKGNPRLVEDFVGGLMRVDEESYLACCAALAQYDGRRRISALDLPTVFIGAVEDEGTPSTNMNRMALNVKGARFVETAGSHLAPVESPAPIAVAIEQLVALGMKSTAARERESS